MRQQVQTKWCLNVPFTDGIIQVLCCSEVRRCVACPRNACGIHDMNCPLCPQRELPICASCSDELSRPCPEMPPFALANEMWIGYIKEYIYEHQVTYIELLCASPVNTAMLSLTLQRFNDRVSGSSLAHLSNARLGAKGNVTCFSLPWEEILQTFSQNGGSNHLPRLGQDLAGLVQVVVESHTYDDTQLVVQHGRVCRAVVVHLIACMIERNHPAYVGINIVDVEQRSTLLPVDGIPPEMIRVIVPHKNGRDLHDGKAALPHEHGHSIHGNIFLSHVNGVQLDRYSNSAVGINEQRIHRIQSVEEDLKSPTAKDEMSSGKDEVECISSTPPNLSSHISAMSGQEYEMQSVDSTKTNVSTQRSHCGDKQTNTTSDQPVDSETLQDSIDSVCIQTGTTMQDQLHPSFTIILFAFLFEFGVGSPDVRNCSQWRRDSNAPRVDFPQFAAALVRRIEGQFRRDWIFVFAVWYLIFRSVINLSRYIFKGRLCDGTTLESEQITAEQYCNASKAITASLTGSYLTTDGSLRQVNGDLSKVPFVPNLPPPS